MTTPAAPDESIRLRPGLEDLPAYVPGRPARSDRRRRFKISSNESPFPPLPEVREAVLEALEHTELYPDMGAGMLRDALAAEHGVEPTRICPSTGSVAVAGDLVRALVGEGDEVVFAWRSFEAYPILVGSHGGRSVPVPLTAGLEHDLDAMAAAITERTRLVFLCTPNNPTGPSLSTARLEAFLARVPADVVVAIDEAYREFHDPDTVADTASLFARHGNVVLLRTFSKAQGLAGLRLGYAVAHPRLARALSAVTVPFGASAPAQAAALATLRPEVRGRLEERSAWVRDERTRLHAGLVAQGWDLPVSQGNFVYLPLGSDSAAFCEHADRYGVVLRAYGDDGVRASIGERVASDLLLEAAASWRER